MKRAYREKRASAHRSAARNQERANKSLTNRLSTLCFSIDLHKISLACVSEDTFRTMSWKYEGRKANRYVGISF